MIRITWNAEEWSAINVYNKMARFKRLNNIISFDIIHAPRDSFRKKRMRI